MSKICVNFLKNLRDIKNFLILSEDKDEFILGVNITFSEYKKTINTFSVFEGPMDKIVPAFFLLTIRKKESEKEKLFKKYGLPVLHIDIEKLDFSLDELKNELNDFVIKVFDCR